MSDDKQQELMMSQVRIEENIKTLTKDVADIKEALKTDYVRRASFEPVQKITWTVVFVFVTAVVTALAGLVISGGMP